MRVRLGTIDDAETIASLHLTSWQNTYASFMPERYLKEIAPVEMRQDWEKALGSSAFASGNAILFIASDSDPIAGFIFAELKDDGRVLIEFLHVAPGRLGGGIGTLLMRHAFEWAQTQHSGRDVYLEVWCDNTKAIGFYEHLGGRRTDTRTEQLTGFSLAEYEYTWSAQEVVDWLKE
ncbi:MAG: GNAT family N-acetyltransferase [Corynebacteriales bacterium]|nr:GNAT family N-acetyltransferase [Mycobacteriales bacterium]